MGKVIKVGMADMAVSSDSSDMLITYALGSCVGVSIYDPDKKVGGLIHVMLPSSDKFKADPRSPKFADTGVPAIVEDIIKIGGRKNKLIAKIAGGAQMFASSSKSKSSVLNIGKRNVEAVKENLKKLNIPIVAEDTGANYARTMEFYLEDGRVLIKTIGKGEKVL